MTAPRRVGMVALEAERLLVFLEAAYQVTRSSEGRPLPLATIAAIREMDRLGGRLNVGAYTFTLELAGDADRAEQAREGRSS